MAKANVKLPNGTLITIEGTDAEVVKIIHNIRNENTIGIYEKRTEKQSGKDKHRNKMTIGDMLLELREEGFFNDGKSVVEVKHALAQKGHMYEFPTVSTQLIRQTQRRNLGRVKENKKWVYVKR